MSRPAPALLAAEPLAAYYAGVREAEFLESTLAAARLTGWLAYHTRDSRRCAPGFPDVVLCHPAHRLLVCAELKSERGRLAAAQAEWLAALAAVERVNVGVWRPRQHREIAEWLAKPKGVLP